MWPAPVERAFAYAVEAYPSEGLPESALTTAVETVRLLWQAGYRDRGVLCAAMLCGLQHLVGADDRFGAYAAGILREIATRPSVHDVGAMSRSARVVLLARIIAEHREGLGSEDRLAAARRLAASLGPYRAADNALVSLLYAAT